MPESDVRAALASGLADLAAAEGCDTLGMLYLDRHEHAADVSRVWGAPAPLVFSAQTLLTGEWSDFDDYVATLKRSRRNKVRRELREYEASGIRTTIWHGTGKLDERTAKLQLAVREKYGVGGSIESITRDYDDLNRTVDDHVLVFLAEMDGEPVGMCLALLDGDRLHLRLVGFDYEKAGDFLYFNVLFYEPIRWGIANGITSYMFGTGSYSAKLARGCRPQPLYAVNRWPEFDRAECEKRVKEHAEALSAQLAGSSG
jgi:predicted N-acyltransferase